MLFLEISQNSQEILCARVCFIKKETLAQVFSGEFCETSKNTYFTDHIRMAGSKEIPLFIILMYSWWHEVNRATEYVTEAEFFCPFIKTCCFYCQNKNNS